MSESSPVVAEPEINTDALGLVDRLDPAIGEATSMVGAMLTELLRRTLRGGVLRIGDEMHGYVSEKVDTVIAQRTPGLEQLATEVAEHAARTAATEVATEEVHALETRTRASDLELAGKITETAKTAEERTKESAAELTGKITETAKTAEERTREAAVELTTQINESEKRGQAALQEQVQTLIERSHERSERLKARFAEQDNLIAMLQESHATLTDAIHKLEQQKRSLLARVAELEKPRGLRALWLRLFGRRVAKPAVTG